MNKRKEYARLDRATPIRPRYFHIKSQTQIGNCKQIRQRDSYKGHDAKCKEASPTLMPTLPHHIFTNGIPYTET
jgi:hypothetical protein